MKVKTDSKLWDICPSRGGHPSTGNPVGLSGEFLFDLVGVGEGTPVGHRHDFTGTEPITVGGDEQALTERPTSPVTVNDTHIPGREKFDQLSSSVRRIFTTFPTSSCRDMNLNNLRNPFSLDTIQSRMLVYRAKCSHRESIHDVSICLRNLLSGIGAYNVYYTTTYAALILNSFKDFLQSSRTISPRAFCFGVF